MAALRRRARRGVGRKEGGERGDGLEESAAGRWDAEAETEATAMVGVWGGREEHLARQRGSETPEGEENEIGRAHV